MSPFATLNQTRIVTASFIRSSCLFSASFHTIFLGNIVVPTWYSLTRCSDRFTWVPITGVNHLKRIAQSCCYCFDFSTIIRLGSLLDSLPVSTNCRRRRKLPNCISKLPQPCKLMENLQDAIFVFSWEVVQFQFQTFNKFLLFPEWVVYLNLLFSSQLCFSYQFIAGSVSA